ncbi:galactose oxidase [Gigaspora margarita]|uniref:Galactose oxidase n=1 Tax=Gigaspora margarita TaxID=4874 RepID=A0A8H3XHD3_GIGMA|nr:galactose oxidase [Gigaspora margarita]
MPSVEVLATSCLSSINKSTVYIIGGQALDQTTQTTINPPLMYAFNSITSQWTTVTTTGFYNYSITLARDANVGPNFNTMNVLNTKTLTWSSLNLITNIQTLRVSYTATLLNNSLITCIGGLDASNININMNEQTTGNTVTARNSHSAVLSMPYNYIGSSSANSSTRGTTNPDIAALNTNVSPYE